MAKITLLPCLKKRDYLNAQVFDRKECIKYGELYQKEGFLSDAIDFFAKAEAEEKLKALLPQVISEGDVFLFTKIYRELKETPSQTAWREIGEAAFKLGKWQFALKAFQALDDKDKVAEIESLLREKNMFFITVALPGTGEKTKAEVPKLQKRKKERKK